jgi:HEAT repeat protein
MNSPWNVAYRSAQTFCAMKNRNYAFVLAFVAGIGLAYLVLGLWRHVSRKPSPKVAEKESANIASPRNDGAPANVQQTKNGEPVPSLEQMRIAFDKIAGGLKKFGLTKIPPADDYLKDAIASHDRAQILRAFTEIIYSGRWRMNEAIPALKKYVDNPDPSVRYLAGKDLLTVGDESGSKTLIELVRSGQLIMDSGQDLRVEAATMLAKFHETDAIDAILSLDRMGADGLGEAYANLGIPFSNEAKYGFLSNSLAITEYAKMDATMFLPQITNIFQTSKDLELKASAAWALATMQGDQEAIGFLVQTAQPLIEGSPGSITVASRDALLYLGSVQSPLAKSALERALDSQVPTALEIAVTNLIINQGGSEKAVDLIARQLNGDSRPGSTMNWELTLSLAAQLSSNPEIQTAGHRFGARNPAEWQLYTVDRANWRIYSWARGYTKKINK